MKKTAFAVASSLALTFWAVGEPEHSEPIGTIRLESVTVEEDLVEYVWEIRARNVILAVDGHLSGGRALLRDKGKVTVILSRDRYAGIPMVLLENDDGPCAGDGGGGGSIAGHKNLMDGLPYAVANAKLSSDALHLFTLQLSDVDEAYEYRIKLIAVD